MYTRFAHVPPRDPSFQLTTKPSYAVSRRVPWLRDRLAGARNLVRRSEGVWRISAAREQPDAHPVSATSAISGIATSNFFIACRQTRGSPCPLTKMVLPGGLVVCT